MNDLLQFVCPELFNESVFTVQWVVFSKTFFVFVFHCVIAGDQMECGCCWVSTGVSATVT